MILDGDMYFSEIVYSPIKASREPAMRTPSKGWALRIDHEVELQDYIIVCNIVFSGKIEEMTKPEIDQCHTLVT